MADRYQGFSLTAESLRNASRRATECTVWAYDQRDTDRPTFGVTLVVTDAFARRVLRIERATDEQAAGAALRWAHGLIDTETWTSGPEPVSEIRDPYWNATRHDLEFNDETLTVKLLQAFARMGRIAAALDYAPFLDVLGFAEVLGVGLQRVQGLLGELAIRGFIEGHGYSNRPELGNARITAAGYERLDDLLGVSASPSMTAVSREVLSYLDGDDFRSRFPSAARSWEHASNLLAGPEPNSGMIGYACREAMQAFAGELVELHRVADPPPRTSVTLSIQAVAIREHVGKSKSEFYAALVKYWSSVYDLSQRQAKNAVREGEELTPDDARRVVFQTAVVMHELAQVPIAEERG